MSIRFAVPLIEPALDALGLDDPEGLQLFSADSLSALHHPLLNPDFPALLPSSVAPDFAKIRHVLGNQYPDDHAIQIVRRAGSGITVEVRRLGELAHAALPDGTEWTVIYVPPLPQASSFERFQETIAHLRAPEGCPWDRKQSHASLRPYLLEETYEVLDALDTGDMSDLREELGDLLLQIVLHAQIAVEAGEFSMADVIAAVNGKIIRRHPHVWGTVEVDDDQEVKVNWDRLKQAEEKNENRESRLDGVPKSLPALSQAYSYQERAARVRFDWDTIAPVIDKVGEEMEELLSAPDHTSREMEVGDLLFAVVNWARWLGVEPESALREANARFYRRFNYVERRAVAQNHPLDSMSLAEMDALWEAAKASGL
ncbi:MAG TPA: nucleoside triphosphate pyrophosphohydrolase [Aggregatilineaceae bacterium]|nr:nucleoside triphosphate pyrophosphohydrolase [Aggregatilineaceae bacterium]